MPADAATTPTPPTAPTEPDTGHRALRNRWIVLVAGLVVLALAGAGTLVYRGLVHASVAHGSTTSASSATSTAATSPPTTATTTSAPATTTSTPSPTLSPPRPVTVRGTARWTDAGVPLVAGQTFVVHASGTVSYIQAAPPVGPDGDPQPHPASVCVLPGTAHHAGLIGRISASGTPFLVGSDFSGPAAGSGELFLGINDVGVDNNSGAFTATVQVAQP